VIVGAIVIFAAAYADTWLGVAAAVVVVAGLAAWIRRGPKTAGPATRTAGHRVLVVTGPDTSDVPAPEGATEILLVAVGGTEERAAALGRRLSRPGVEVRHTTSGAEGLPAVEAALQTFAADEIVVAGDEALAAAIGERAMIPVRPS
jgi:hypothetical protein